MEEFIRSYGIWILLAGIFFAMHRFGMGRGGGHRHDAAVGDAPAKPGEEKTRTTPSGGCH